jgi:DNA-binding MarR family transcriptional regulator
MPDPHEQASDHQPHLVDEAVERLASGTRDGAGPDAANADTAAGILVWAYLAGRQLDVWLANALGEAGLTTSEYGALAGVAFAGEHALTAGDLARWTVQTSGGTTKTVQRLVERGLVRRAADADDGRRTLIRPTDEGLRVAAAVVDDLVVRLDRDLNHLDAVQRARLLDALRGLSAGLGPGSDTTAS